MREGIRAATNENIVFLDGDIEPYPEKTIQLLSEPLIKGEADLIKSAFARNAGRVTELVAKPLLSIFFPELLKFSQPLSGMVGGKKSLFTQLEFRDDYGVDIGILIDTYLMNLPIKEVTIGYIENRSKPWQALGKMSKEVAQTIILKAATNKNPLFNFEELGVLNEIQSQMEDVLQKQLMTLNKLVVFDMDNTLLKGRFIDTCAGKFGFREQLMSIRSSEQDIVIRTKQIAMLLKGLSLAQLTEVADSMTPVGGTQEIISELKKRGYITGIISDSYDCITNHVKNKLGMDFSLANSLEFTKNICTGEVKLPSLFFINPGSQCKHTVCKTNALLSILEKYNLKIENTIAIGDSRNDLCMIKKAGLGISFCSNDELLNHFADLVISKPDFAEILEFAV